jgi:hypothetical protein
MPKFARCLLDMLLGAGYPELNLFQEHHEDGAQGPTVTAEDGRTSRVMEGACRHRVKDRMDRTRMRSTLEGARAILHLRTLYHL